MEKAKIFFLDETSVPEYRRAYEERINHFLATGNKTVTHVVQSASPIPSAYGENHQKYTETVTVITIFYTERGN